MMGILSQANGLQPHQLQQCELKADYRSLGSRRAKDLAQPQRNILHELPPDLIDHQPHSHRFIIHIEDRSASYPFQNFMEDTHQVHGVRGCIFLLGWMIALPCWVAGDHDDSRVTTLGLPACQVVGGSALHC